MDITIGIAVLAIYLVLLAVQIWVILVALWVPLAWLLWASERMTDPSLSKRSFAYFLVHPFRLLTARSQARRAPHT